VILVSSNRSQHCPLLIDQVALARIGAGRPAPFGKAALEHGYAPHAVGAWPGDASIERESGEKGDEDENERGDRGKVAWGSHVE
jgi:hypothetical protein